MIIVSNEVWILIFGLLSKRDLKSLRLCGIHELGSLVSSLLFTTAYLAARKAVLNTFLVLMTHPEFSNYVKEIVYDSSYIIPYVVEGNRDNKCGSSLAIAFEEQEDILDGELQKALDKASISLSNVKMVRYADMSRIAFLPGDCNNPTWEQHDYEEEPLIRRIDSKCNQFYETRCRLKPNIICQSHEESDHDHMLHMKFGGLIPLMQALSSSTATRLSYLSLGNRVHAAGNGGISFRFFSPANADFTHPFLYPVFSSLRKLQLAISSDWPSTLQHKRCSTISEQSRNTFTLADNDSYHMLDLAKPLSSAVNLQEVKLAGECLICSLQLATTFSSHTWSKLQVVHLEYFKGSQEQLEGFVKRHVASLRHLLVDHFVLTSGSWRTLGALIPAVAPELELIFGIVYEGNCRYPMDQIFQISYKNFDKSGLKIKNRRGRCSGEYEDEDRDEDLNVLEDGSEDDSLCYSSDDSTPSTASSPRRKPDIDILSTLTPTMRDNVDYIREALPGCPVQECRDTLVKTNGDREAARSRLFNLFGYTELECLVRES